MLCHSPVGGGSEADIVRNLVEQGEVSMVNDPKPARILEFSMVNSIPMLTVVFQWSQPQRDAIRSCVFMVE